MEGFTAPAGEEAPARGQSIEDELGAVFDGLLAERRPELFELPGWGRKLMAKYRVLEQEEGNEIGERVGEQVAAKDIEVADAPLTVLIDGVIKTCLGFYTEIDSEVRPLNEVISEPTEKLIKWDRALASLFSKRLEKVFAGETDVSGLSARQILRGILKNDDRLVGRHVRQVNNWSGRELEAVHLDFTDASPETGA